MTVKLAQIERALVTDNILRRRKSHLDRRQRAVITLRLEYFERVAVRLQYHKNDLLSRNASFKDVRDFNELSTDILLLASLWHPFHRVDMEHQATATQAINAFLLLYDAAYGLLDGKTDLARQYINQARSMSKPYGFGSAPYGGYDEYVKAILELPND